MGAINNYFAAVRGRFKLLYTGIDRMTGGESIAFCERLFARYLGPRFPRFVKNGYEPLFFDPTLSFSEP